MTKEEARLASVITECQKHLSRLDYAYHKLAPLIPFTAATVNHLSDEEISSLDQYIFRFSKLQDTIGQKLFKIVLQSMGEEVYNKSFIDIFNRLEQLGIVENYDLWNELRIIRNDISHEYDENKYELAEKMNKIIESKKALQQYLTDVLSYLADRGILPKSG